MNTNVLYYMEYNKEMQISLANGNTKLGKGIYTYNLLPGDKPISSKTRGQLTNVPGTCAGCCDGCIGACYAMRDCRFHFNSVIPALAKNTLIMRHDIDGMFGQLKGRLVKHKAKVCRFHSAGELPHYNYLLHMVKLAVEMPDVQFYCYTKRFNLIQKYIEEYKVFPKNLVINISVWKGNDKGYDFGHLNKFVYDDHSDPEVMKLPHCPAVNAKGRSTGIKCVDCGLCFKENCGRIIAVHAH